MVFGVKFNISNMWMLNVAVETCIAAMRHGPWCTFYSFCAEVEVFFVVGRERSFNAPMQVGGILLHVAKKAVKLKLPSVHV